jgi:ATP-dependent RNA helicase DDX49/DBP8
MKKYKLICTSFKQLGIGDWLISTLRSFGISQPTNVQKHCIPHVLSGKNIVCCAQTGCGKTAAFILPIIQCLSKDLFGMFSLTLTPTRELAFQIGEQFKAFGSGVQIRVEIIIGGLDIKSQSKKLCDRPHVVVATLGRIFHVLTEYDIYDMLKSVKFLVLDEADKILAANFNKYLKTVLQYLPRTKFGRRTLLYLASMTQSIENLIKIVFKDIYLFQEQIK